MPNAPTHVMQIVGDRGVVVQEGLYDVERIEREDGSVRFKAKQLESGFEVDIVPGSGGGHLLVRKIAPEGGISVPPSGGGSRPDLKVVP